MNENIAEFVRKFSYKPIKANTVTELSKLIERSKHSLEEGFVLEDREGQFLKVKLPIYKDIRVLREIYKKGDWDKISREEVRGRYNDLPITRSFLLSYTQEQFEGLQGRNFIEKVYSQKIEELI